MLPRSSRLNLTKTFKWVAGGRRVVSEYTTLFYRFGDNQGAKVGIALTSKIFNKSTQRNRAKRRTAVFFEKNLKYLPGNINIVVLPKQGVLEVESDLLAQDMVQALRDENLYSQ